MIYRLYIVAPMPPNNILYVNIDINAPKLKCILLSVILYNQRTLVDKRVTGY